MCKDVVDFSQGRASLRSNGIMDFKVIIDQSEPNVFYFWERYDGNASMGRHNTCPELKAFMENVRACCLWTPATRTPYHSTVLSSVGLPCNCPPRWAVLEGSPLVRTLLPSSVACLRQ